MKQIPLKSNKYFGKVALVDDDDFEYLNQFQWYVYKAPHNFYAVRNTQMVAGQREVIRMHRQVLGVVDSNIQIDHFDWNGLNNQKKNLRIANASQNGANRRAAKNATSKYIGVCWLKNKNKWKAQITKDKTCQYLGSFQKEIDAALAYNQKAIELHGEFANLNKVEYAI